MAKDWDSMSKGAKDIVLHADNDKQLQYSSHEPIIKNLAKKHANGVYDSDKATKLWGYHADRAAMSCCKKHGGGKDVWHKMFPTTDRKQAASHWEALHRDNLQNESINENTEEFHVNDEEYQKDILAMIQAAFEDKPATFAEHFANAIQPKLTDTIEAMKNELKKFVFNHTSGNFMEGVNNKSRMLLSAKAKKKPSSKEQITQQLDQSAWKEGEEPEIAVA
jgi:hypothetical protein